MQLFSPLSPWYTEQKHRVCWAEYTQLAVHLITYCRYRSLQRTLSVMQLFSASLLTESTERADYRIESAELLWLELKYSTRIKQD